MLCLTGLAVCSRGVPLTAWLCRSIPCTASRQHCKQPATSTLSRCYAPVLIDLTVSKLFMCVQAEQLKAKAPAAIIGVKARQVFDSRGNPTVEAEVKTHKVSSLEKLLPASEQQELLPASSLSVLWMQCACLHARPPPPHAPTPPLPACTGHVRGGCALWRLHRRARGV